VSSAHGEMRKASPVFPRRTSPRAPPQALGHRAVPSRFALGRGGVCALLVLPLTSAFVLHARPVGRAHGARLALSIPSLFSGSPSSAAPPERAQARPPAGAFRMMSAPASGALQRLEDLAKGMDNSLIRELVKEETDLPHTQPREVSGVHYTLVKTQPVEKPYLVSYSKECAELIGLEPEECKTDDFAQVFGGNKMLEGMEAWATVYGCHHYGHWFGQLGDGRAISIGEVVNAHGQRLELQLKGAGPTPYSRRFDGRAVLRSSIREFLASEALHHLRVPGTRALCVVGTSEYIMRAWYADKAEIRSSSEGKPSPMVYPPSMPSTEPGAVMCRVAPSFLRFAHLELFWRRGQFDQMAQMADHVIKREFPELLELGLGKAETYVKLFDAVNKRLAVLIGEWMRVGYVQGNMNSDNTALGGFTIDFGPFGMVEEYNPLWTPFTSDQERKFSFTQQPQAGRVNIAVLCEAFKALVEHVEGGEEAASKLVEELEEISSEKYATYFSDAYGEHCRNKLGLEDREKAFKLWLSLTKCMAQSQVDWTLFFRLLADAQGGDLAEGVKDAFYAEPAADVQAKWNEWYKTYEARVEEEGEDREKRVAQMKLASPKYIMRNWMMTMAYERAEQGDFSLVDELLEVLRDPYGEQSKEVQDKWFQKTPPWARMMPGVSFMS